MHSDFVVQSQFYFFVFIRFERAAFDEYPQIGNDDVEKDSIFFRPAVWKIIKNHSKSLSKLNKIRIKIIIIRWFTTNAMTTMLCGWTASPADPPSKEVGDEIIIIILIRNRNLRIKIVFGTRFWLETINLSSSNSFFINILKGYHDGGYVTAWSKSVTGPLEKNNLFLKQSCRK